jgi:hypothetical protein
MTGTAFPAAGSPAGALLLVLAGSLACSVRNDVPSGQVYGCGEDGNCPAGLECGPDSICVLPTTASDPDATPAATDPATSDRSICDQPPAGVSLCDGFDDGAVAPSWQPLHAGGGSTTLSPTAYRGTGALRATVGPGGRAQVWRPLVPAIGAGSIQVRALFLVPSGPQVVKSLVLLELATPSVTEKFSFDVGPEDAGRIVTTIATPLGVTGSPATVPRARWFCAELSVTMADPGLAVVRIDGAETALITSRNTTPTVAFSQVGVGVISSSDNTGDAEVLVDEVIAGTAPLGCP